MGRKILEITNLHGLTIDELIKLEESYQKKSIKSLIRTVIMRLKNSLLITLIMGIPIELKLNLQLMQELIINNLGFEIVYLYIILNINKKRLISLNKKRY